MDRRKPMARINKQAEEPGEPGVFTAERLALKLSEAQRQTILKYAELPAHLAERLSAQHGETLVQFTLDDLDELLDRVEMAVFRAKGNEKQKVLRIGQKVAGLLGSEIIPSRPPRHRASKKAPTIFQIKMTLNGIDPRIWRRIQTEDCTLAEVHEIIQVTMGWEFEHLYLFTIGGVDYSDLEMTSDEEAEDACDTRLSAVLPTENRRPRFSYEYDFGDQWIHQMIVEERLPPQQGVNYPICLAGQRACPPEDCGGPWGYSDFVKAITNPEHESHEELLEWVGGEFDSERFDLEAVNNELQRMRRA
jgi:hypothetical protein